MPVTYGFEQIVSAHVKCKCMGKDKMGRISFSIKDAM